MNLKFNVSFFFLFAGLLLCRAGIHAYADESVLSQGRFVKVQIEESGLYKMTYSELSAKGIEPSNVRVFGYGGAMLNEDFSKAMLDDLPEIAVYDTGSAILFYAQGVNKWTYDTSLGMFTHLLNPYSNYGYYFVTSDEVGEKKRITKQPVVNTGAYTPNVVTEFTDYAVHEEELTSLIAAGRELFGEKFVLGTKLDLSFEFPNLVSGSEQKVRLDVANISTLSTNSKGEVTKNNKSTFSLKLNNSQVKNFEVDGREGYDYAAQADATYNFISDGKEKMAFCLSFSNPKEATATGYLNYVEVNVQRHLKMAGSVMPFHNKQHIGTNSYNRYQLQTTNAGIQVWNITDPQQVVQMSVENASGILGFVDKANSAASYLAVDVKALSDIPSATLLEEVPSQNLHGLEATDMLIITHPDFLTPANTLAEAHNTYNDGLRVKVVMAEQVYNEFSSGTPDATAYRRICKMLYDRPADKSDRLKYLLLIGKGSYDNRSVLANSGDHHLLTFQAAKSINSTKAYATDDYFGLLDDKEGTKIGTADRIDIGIGRLPVRTEEEAKNVVDKIVRYMKNEDKGAWKNQLCFIGDNGDSNSHMRQADSFANMVSRSYPAYYVNKLLLDAYQQDELTSNYPDAKRSFQNQLASGLLMVNYMGHGTTNGWGRILHISEIKTMTNERLPLFVSGTCEFSRFDREYMTSGEELLKNAEGGAIGVFSATRTVYQNYNETIVRHFTDSIFSLPKKELGAVGDAVRMAKNASFGSLDLGTNTLSYVYFGDPAVKLNYPTDYQVVATEINGHVIQNKDTLKAVSVSTLKGVVRDTKGIVQSDLNGELEIVVLDKEETRKTLGNLGNTPYSYKDRSRVVAKGKTKVEDGHFEYTFMLPRDVKPNYGKGRFSFYAWDEDNDYEAQGYNENFIIGGSNPDFVDETDGPDVKIYLNNEKFISGDKVGETPLFIASLYDINGINTYSTTPGHDLMLCIDNESWYTLNDYYVSSGGDYRRGTISYNLPKQSEGKHILMLRAWDFLGNSAVKTLEYEVVNGLTANSDFSVDCYPNPVKSTANIQVNYNNEEDIEQVMLEVFDLSGRRVWMKTQDDLSTVSWSVSGNAGGNIASGMYVLRVSITTHSGIVTTKSNKIMVAQQ